MTRAPIIYAESIVDCHTPSITLSNTLDPVAERINPATVVLPSEGDGTLDDVSTLSLALMAGRCRNIMYWNQDITELDP